MKVLGVTVRVTPTTLTDRAKNEAPCAVYMSYISYMLAELYH